MKPDAAPIFCLVPFDPAEGVSLSIAARRAGKSESTVRAWCKQRGIGRRVGDGAWVVSQVALAMWLDGREQALRQYLAGDRSAPAVVAYFHRFNLRPLTLDEGAEST